MKDILCQANTRTLGFFLHKCEIIAEQKKPAEGGRCLQWRQARRCLWQRYGHRLQHGRFSALRSYCQLGGAFSQRLISQHHTACTWIQAWQQDWPAKWSKNFVGSISLCFKKCGYQRLFKNCFVFSLLFWLCYDSKYFWIYMHIITICKTKYFKMIFKL